MRKKQKGRIRKSIKYTYIIIAIMLIIISSTSLILNLSDKNIKTETRKIYNYTNKFNYAYKVSLIENEFIRNNEITDRSIAYVTGLIDFTELDLNYDFVADKTSNLKCTYSVVGKMQVVYTKDGEEQKIWDEEEILVPEKNIENEADKININEKLILDLKDRNARLEKFKQDMGMSIDAKYKVILNVSIITSIDNQEVKVDYNPTVELDLAEKTTKVSGKNELEESNSISKEYKENISMNEVIIVIDSTLLLIALILIIHAMKYKGANRVKNEYRKELNRILKICEDKIVQISSKPNDNSESIVYVKDFGEILKVSEELFKPILYYFDNENDEAWFSVITESTIYRYIFKD